LVDEELTVERGWSVHAASAAAAEAMTVTAKSFRNCQIPRDFCPQARGQA
jgi:hypothetical protein